MTVQNAGGSSISSGDFEIEDLPDELSIVFVHGAGISKEMWRPQLDSLSGAFQVVAFDLPGHGARADTSFEFEVAVTTLDRVINEVGTPVVLVGPVHRRPVGGVSRRDLSPALRRPQRRHREGTR